MASSNDIEVLDPTATVEKLKNIVSKVALNRRHFMAALGMAGVAAGTGLVSRRDADAQQPTPNGFLQVDVLNFLLNIKYLKATFYSYITQGADIPASTYVTLATSQVYMQPAQITTTSASPFTSQISDLFNEMYYDELNQLVDLRSLLGSAAVNRPLLNLAGTSASNTTFAAPSATQTLTAVQAIAQARMLEDVSVTAFAGALTYLTGTNLAYAAQILAVDGCHAAALRLASIQNPNVLYQGTLYQSSFSVSTAVTSNNLYAQLTSTKAVAGDVISGVGIPQGSVITAITPNPNVTFSGIMTNGSASIVAVTGISGGLSIANLAVGQPITGTSLTGNSFIVSPPSGTTITLNQNTKATPGAVSATGYVTSGSAILTGVSSISGLTIGQPITGATGFLGIPSTAGIPSGATITATASGTAIPTTITMSTPATTTPMVTFTGVVTSGSSTITPVAGTAGLAVGQPISFASTTAVGIPAGTIISNLGSNITMGSTSGATVYANGSSATTQLVTFNGILTTGSKVITNVSSTTGLVIGQPLTAGVGIAAGNTIASFVASSTAATVTMVTAANASSTVSTTGAITSGSKTIANVQSINGMIVGQALTGTTGIQPSTTITALTPAAGATPASITMSNAASLTPATITFSAITTAGSNQLTNVVTAINGSSLSGLVVGQPIIGPGIPAGTTITFIGTVAPFTVGMSQAATITFTPSTFLCDIKSGSNQLYNVSDITGLALGQCIYISGAGTTGIPTNTVISAITPNTITELGNFISMASATTWTGTTGTAVTALTTFSNGATITTAQILTSPAQITLTSPALEPVYSGGSVLTSPSLSTFNSPSAQTFTVGQGSITISQPATATGVVTATIATSDPAEVVPFDPGTAALAAAGPVIDPNSSPAVYQGFFATAGSGNASSTSPAGFAYARTFSQVLQVLYANNATSIYEGGFFPVGVAGNINVT